MAELESPIARKLLFTLFDRPKLRSTGDYPWDAPGNPLSMNIQEHLSAFDGWLTSRLEEAHARRKDLAFRDLDDEPVGASATLWEYSLLEPGARSPHGEGWSIYRLNGVWPESPAEPDVQAAPPAASERRSLLDVVVGAVLGRDAQRR